MKSKIAMLALIPSLFVAATVHAADLKCEAVLSALALTTPAGSLGLAGAFDVTDTATGEKARIFISQTGATHVPNLDEYAFAVTNVASLQGRGQLFADLDNRTNFMLLEVHAASFEHGCQAGFSPREINERTSLVSKTIQSVAPGKVVFQKGQPTSITPLNGELVIEYHGPQMD